MTRYKDMKMLTKILLLASIIIVLVSAPIFLFVLPKVEAQIREDKRIQLQDLVTTAYTLVEGYYKQYQAGLLSEDSAKKESLRALKNIRYEGDNYYWVNDLHPTMIMHPIKSEMDGQDQSDYKDPNGKKLFVEIARVCEQSGEGTVDYVWSKPGSSKPAPKLAYTKLFKAWGWCIGSGIYVDDIQAVIGRLKVFVIGIISVSLVLAFFISYFMSKKMAETVIKVVDLIKDIAQGEGDLTKRLVVDSKDEVGQLAQWFNTFADKVHDIIAQVASTTGQVASASQQLSASSEEMASGAEEQTAQTSQVATSVEEMSATVQQVAKNANEAASSAKNAGDTAKKGGDVVQQTISGINEIAASTKASAEAIQNLSRNSEQIGNIIKVIDDVADQTNLLALNAAIEAARAGEQGRGFAVVADEVRKLAERTTASTKEISEMVKTMQEGTVTAVSVMADSSKGVDKGVKLAEQAGHILREIVNAAQHVVDLVQQVATAAEEQSAAAEEISSNVESVASVTKQSAQGTQQISSAAQELSGLSEGLQSLVNKFKLRDGSVKVLERKSTLHKEAAAPAATTATIAKKPSVKKFDDKAHG